MGSSLFLLGSLKKNPERDPNVENYPHGGFNDQNSCFRGS